MASHCLESARIRSKYKRHALTGREMESIPTGVVSLRLGHSTRALTPCPGSESQRNTPLQQPARGHPIGTQPLCWTRQRGQRGTKVRANRVPACRFPGKPCPFIVVLCLGGSALCRMAGLLGIEHKSVLSTAYGVLCTYSRSRIGKNAQYDIYLCTTGEWGTSLAVRYRSRSSSC
jgi:hypothetical protein